MKPYANNPRRISKKRHDRLAETLDRLGDLGGIVHDLNTDQVIGGNQRMTVFRDGDVTITEAYDQPDEQGTVAHGFVVWHGHKFAYRQVRWDDATAREANIAANLGAGEWDWDSLANWDVGELQEWGFDSETLQNWYRDAGALGNLLKSEASEEWKGMPEFDNEPKAYRTIHVHFRNEDDCRKFAEAIDKEITDNTVSLWYPEKQDNLHMNKSLIYRNES